MTQHPRNAALALIVGFLATIFGVPLAQVGVELARSDRIHYTDLFRYRPSEKNLRAYEDTLQDTLWLRQAVRPAAQRLLLDTLGEGGPMVIAGRGGWVFYRPDFLHLIDAGLADPVRLDPPSAEPPDSAAAQLPAARAILRFRDQLKARGINLMVVPVPGKATVYPDKLSGGWAAGDLALSSRTRLLLDTLRAQGVTTVDLFSRFQDARRAGPAPSPGEELYLLHDTHWTPRGAQIAAETVARAVRAAGWAPPETHQFLTRPVRLRRYGDLLAMLQLGDLRGNGWYPEVTCEQVVDEEGSLLAPTRKGRSDRFRYPSGEATVLVIGDSLCRYYQSPEPLMLGEIIDPPPAPAPPAADGQPPAQRGLLPGSAGFVSHLALALKAPVDCITSDGGAATEVRLRLSTDREILDGKRLVIWEFAEHEIQLGARDWQDVPLPDKLSGD